MKKEYNAPEALIVVLQDNLLDEVISPGPDTPIFDTNNNQVFEDEGDNNASIWSDYDSGDE